MGSSFSKNDHWRAFLLSFLLLLVVPLPVALPLLLKGSMAFPKAGFSKPQGKEKTSGVNCELWLVLLYLHFYTVLCYDYLLVCVCCCCCGVCVCLIIWHVCVCNLAHLSWETAADTSSSNLTLLKTSPKQFQVLPQKQVGGFSKKWQAQLLSFFSN